MPRITTAILALLAISIPALTAQAIIRKVPEQYATIQAALDDSREGDIVLVAPGNYAESLLVQRSVYLISEEPGGAIIDADMDDAIRAEHLDGDMIQVIGFTIQNCRAGVVVTESSGAVVDTKISGCMPVDEFEDLISFNGSGDATVARVELMANETFDPATIGLVGMYVDGQSLVVDSSITASNAAGITLHGASAAATGNLLENTNGDAITVAAETSMIRGNTVDNSDGTGVVVPDGTAVYILENDISEAEFGIEFYTEGGSIAAAWVYDNDVLESYQAGVAVMSDLGDLFMGHNRITGGGSRGIWLQDPDLAAMVHDNVVADNEVLGVSIGMAAEGFVESSDVTLKRNLIYGNLSQGVTIQDSDAVLVNNTIFGNGDYGIYHATTAEEPAFFPTFKNNIVVGHAETGVWTDYATCDLTYSLLFDNAVHADVCTGADGVVLDEDPLFLDLASGDFALQVGSPAMDSGDPDPMYDDADGSANDMGAFGGPEEAPLPADEPPVIAFAEEDDLLEGECRTIAIPEGADPEGLPLFVEWSLAGGSNGSWTAYGQSIRLCGEDDGEFTWSVVAIDPMGGTAEADGSMTIVNLAPGITSIIPITATAGVDWLYQIELFDPGYFDTFAYTIESAPDGMTVDEFGVVSWTPSDAQVGDHVVKFVVTDDDGGESFQIDTITVSGAAPTEDPDGEGGCECAQGDRATPSSLAALGLLLLAALRRRIAR